MRFEYLEKAAKILKALAHPKRLEILFLLKAKELNVSELIEKIKISQSSLSQHLGVLRLSGIVKTRKKAQLVYYSVANDKVLKILSLLDKVYNSPYSL